MFHWDEKTRNYWRMVWQLAWPLIVANSFWNLQVTIDRIFLGQYSTEALGAAMGAIGIFWAPMALVQQTAAYVTTFIAQYKGAKQPHMIGLSVWQSIYLSLAGGLLFLILIPLSPSIFYWFGHSAKMQVLEVEYFSALCLSALPTALVACASGFYTGLGQSRMIIWINCVGLIVNVVFDYFLVFGNLGFPELGIQGAGYATAIANLVAAIFAFALVFRKKHDVEYKLYSGWKFNGDLLYRFLKFGLPSGMQWALEGLGFTAFHIFIGRMPNGDAALAASSITVTIMLLALLPALGVGQAVSVLVGQKLGERKPDEAERLSWIGFQMALIYIFITCVTFVLFPSFYLNWFHNADNQAMWDSVSYMVRYLLIFVAVFSIFDTSNIVLSFALKGAGDTRFVTLVALALPWPLMVLPSCWVSEWETGVYWAWGAASLFIIVQALVFVWRFIQGRWKSMSVIH